MNIHALFIYATSLLLSLGAHAASESGMSFVHNDWEVVCDNTLTCRAAGYQSDDQELRVSVLLTRIAGPGQAVTGELTLGSYDNEDLFKKLPQTIELAMKINGKNYGSVVVKQDNFVGKFSNEQVAALLSSLAHSSTIEFVAGANTWHLSDKGAAAVLLKMDDYQGRLGTIGALIKKGNLGEGKVPLAKTLPVVKAAKVALQSNRQLAAKELSTLKSSLRASINADDCPQLFEQQADTEILVSELNNKRALAATLCWRAAYNEGYGYWVINEKPPYRPVLVTFEGSDYQTGVIVATQKGRGLGDCLSSSSWIWDGKQFALTKEATSGMCKLVSPGGAWELPQFVADVRQ